MMSGREVLFEFIRLGNAVKVSALDTETLTEVSIVGNANASQELLKSMALRRLRYVLDKNTKSGNEE
jgi:hypothetical protein